MFRTKTGKPEVPEAFDRPERIAAEGDDEIRGQGLDHLQARIDEPADLRFPERGFRDNRRTG